MLAHPDKPIEQIDIVGDEERRRLLVGWNATAGSWPYASIPSRIARWAQETPDAPAVYFGDTVVSYSQLHKRSARYAGQLVAGGIHPGDIVAVALPRSKQLLIVLLAIMRTGAAFLPLDLDGPAERTALVLEDASPVALIAQPDTLSRFSGGGFVRLQPEPLNGKLSDASSEQDLSAPESVVYVLYTSGSTGRPKGVEITHYNLSNFLEGMRLQL